jgi:hypothetical protein
MKVHHNGKTYDYRPSVRSIVQIETESGVSLHKMAADVAQQKSIPTFSVVLVISALIGQCRGTPFTQDEEDALYEELNQDMAENEGKQFGEWLNYIQLMTAPKVPTSTNPTQPAPKGSGKKPKGRTGTKST